MGDKSLPYCACGCGTQLSERRHKWVLGHQLLKFDPAPEGFKTCTRCATEKPLEDFGKHARMKDGLSTACRECRYAANVIRRLGITWDDYILLMLEHSNKGCAICGDPWEAVDHCHQTGKVRGLLCQRCNLMLGQAQDNVEVLKAAINYLESHAEG